MTTRRWFLKALAAMCPTVLFDKLPVSDVVGQRLDGSQVNRLIRSGTRVFRDCVITGNVVVLEHEIVLFEGCWFRWAHGAGVTCKSFSDVSMIDCDLRHTANGGLVGFDDEKVILFRPRLAS